MRLRVVNPDNSRNQEFDAARGDVQTSGNLTPPGYAADLPAGQINRARGALTRQGFVLPPVFEKFQPGVAARPLVQKPPDVIALEKQKYGDVTNVNFTVGVTDTVILLRPSTTRIHLIIQNTHATQVLTYAFDRNSNIGVVLTAGASAFYDIFVPQGDVHISANGAGTTGIIAFANSDLNSPYAGV